MREEKVFFPCNSIRLEGLASIGEALSVPRGVIACHPHPLYGGDMHGKVIATVVEAASQEGLSTLRFNFRGVGGSQGSYEDGVGERKDVKAAINYLSSMLKGADPEMILVGYSFGAWVGLPAAGEDERIKGVVAIAPPLELYDFGFLKGCKKSKLLIAGDRDFYCPHPILEKFYEQLDEPKAIHIIQGSDHFFTRCSRSLVQPLTEFFENT